MRTYLVAAVLSFAHVTVHAGFFDDMVNQAQQATGQIIEDTVDSVLNGNNQTEEQPSQPVQAAQPAPKPYQPPAPSYDKQLVRDVQIALNEHGYDAGRPDGLYGAGTRRAITAYQKANGLAVDGKPSYTLLVSLQQASEPSAISKPSASSGGPSIPTQAPPAVAESALSSQSLEPTALPAPTGTFTLPGCDVLQPWVANYQRGEMVNVTPRVEFTSLLRPELTRPLFGVPAERWSRDQYSSVYKQMTACRDDAGKRKDKVTFNQFHQAAKGVGKAASAMARVDRFRETAAKTVDKILEHPTSLELPKLVDAAQTALRGEDPMDALSVDPKLAYVAGDVRNLKNYCDYLTEQDRNELIARLESGKADVIAASSTIEKELADARMAIAAAPATPAGLRSLQELNEAPVLQKIGLNEAQAFREEVQQRQREVQTEINRQQAEAQAKAEAEARRPIDLRERLVKLVQGDELEGLSFGGLAPGMSKQQAISTLQRDWKFDFDAGLRINNDFVATRPIFSQLKKERRNGGKVHLGITNDDKVGQIHYVEFYKAMIVTTTPQAWLTKHLGAPDQVSPAQGGRLLTWKSGDLRLQVLATNQIDQVWRFATFQGKLEISFWSEDYEQYLSDLGKRCAKLLEEKRGRGNMSEAMWFGLNCGLDGGAKEHAGI